MNYLLDLIVIAIIAAVALISARRGFVRVVIELVGFIAAIFITLTISTPLASLTYDKIIEPPIVSSVSKATGDSVTQITDDTWNALPEFIRKYSENAGFSKESINKSINENMGNGAVSAAKAASQGVVKPIVAKLLAVLYGIIIMVILIFLVKILAKFLNGVFSFSIVGKLNRILGGIAGIPKGIIIAMLFCMIISLIVSLTPDGFLIFKTEAMEKSWFFTHFSFNLPV